MTLAPDGDGPRIPCVRVLTVVLVGPGFLAATAAPVFSQQSGPGAAQPLHTFDNPSGVRIEVKAEQPRSDAEVLAALEEATRQVCRRLANTSAPTAPVAAAPPTVPAVGPGANARAGRRSRWPLARTWPGPMLPRPRTKRSA
jgi:hypothetical protein